MEPGPPPVATSAAAMIREGCLTRMRRFSHGHASLAAEPPRGRAPGPHGLLFLYAWPSARHTDARPDYEVAAGTRLLDDTDDSRPRHNVRDLVLLLQGLTEVAFDRISAGPFDPRQVMCDRADPMPPVAQFVGIGVSSLGVEDMDWERQRSVARLSLDFPARWMLRLTDRTWTWATRPAGEVMVTIHSTGPVGYGQPYNFISADFSPASDTGLYWLDQLTALVWRTMSDPYGGGRRG